ncbi:hypothetical protein IFR05_008735 [Cadophora sp. M221]|nr:hypothetical protein IFR05_008735 [Cadophora sp. M221]
MANGPPIANPLGLHIADRSLNIILSSSQSPSGHDTSSQLRRQFQTLSSLTTAAINAYDTASWLGLGVPQRIMIETQSSGPIVLTSYLQSPSRGRTTIEPTQENRRLLGENVDERSVRGAQANGVENGTHESRDGELETRNRPPLLIATVVASSAAEVGEARRSAARLEGTGRDFQREWPKKQAEDSGAVTTMGGDDG